MIDHFPNIFISCRQPGLTEGGCGGDVGPGRGGSCRICFGCGAQGSWTVRCPKSAYLSVCAMSGGVVVSLMGPAESSGAC